MFKYILSPKIQLIANGDKWIFSEMPLSTSHKACLGELCELPSEGSVSFHQLERKHRELAQMKKCTRDCYVR